MNPVTMVNPFNVAKGIAGLAGTAVGLTGAAVRATGRVVRPHGTAAGVGAEQPDTGVEETSAVAPDEARAADEVAPRAGDAATPGPELVTPAPDPSPEIVRSEPAPSTEFPVEPPVDVVGEALAAEEAGTAGNGDGLAHEPRGASRDEEHGDAALQRAEADEIAMEADAALRGDVEPEEHLTAPVLDPAEAKAVAAELRTMSRAADPDKG